LASIAVGTDTAAHHLVLVVEQRLVTFFSPHIVLLTNQQELNLEVVAEQQKYVSKTARPRTRKVNIMCPRNSSTEVLTLTTLLLVGT
jgi:hypothetical protein